MRIDDPGPVVISLVLAAAIVILLRQLAFLNRLRRVGLLVPFLAGLRHLPGARRRAWGFSGHLTYPTLVPVGPDGRPGEQLLGPSESAVIGYLASDGSRTDCQILVGRRSYVLVVCLGRVEDRGDPWSSAHQVCTTRPFKPIEPPSAATMAGLPAVTYTVMLADRWLTEWKFVRDGWLFGAGYLRPTNASPRSDQLARATLESWTWLDDPARAA